VPVFGPAPVALQAETHPRQNHDALDLVTRLVLRHSEETPRPLVIAI
jgi:hypothetical protein